MFCDVSNMKSERLLSVGGRKLNLPFLRLHPEQLFHVLLICVLCWARQIDAADFACPRSLKIKLDRVHAALFHYKSVVARETFFF